MYISLWENSRGHPDNISFMQFSTKIDGFEQKDSQGFENSYNSYEQYPLEKFLIFTIYQNYTLALISCFIVCLYFYSVTLSHTNEHLWQFRDVRGLYGMYVAVIYTGCTWLSSSKRNRPRKSHVDPVTATAWPRPTPFRENRLTWLSRDG